VTTWIELEVITLCEISQVQKDSVFLWVSMISPIVGR
jgi:hypothetical protein